VVWRQCDRSRCHSHTANARSANNAKQFLGQWTMRDWLPSAFPAFHNGHSRPLFPSFCAQRPTRLAVFRSRREGPAVLLPVLNISTTSPYLHPVRVPNSMVASTIGRTGCKKAVFALPLPRITFRRLHSAATAGSFGLGRRRLAALPDSPIKPSSALSI
jgi:hypothetical protein